MSIFFYVLYMHTFVCVPVICMYAHLCVCVFLYACIHVCVCMCFCIHKILYYMEYDMGYYFPSKTYPSPPYIVLIPWLEICIYIYLHIRGVNWQPDERYIIDCQSKTGFGFQLTCSGSQTGYRTVNSTKLKLKSRHHRGLLVEI